MLASGFSIVFVVFFLLTLVLRYWLASRHVRHVLAHRREVPPAFAEKVAAGRRRDGSSTGSLAVAEFAGLAAGNGRFSCALLPEEETFESAPVMSGSSSAGWRPS